MPRGSAPAISPAISPISIQTTRSSYIAVTDGRQCEITDEYNISPTILGTGNYGSVHECRHRTTGAWCAVKTICKSKVSRHDHILREIQLLRAVGDHHDGFVQRDLTAVEQLELLTRLRSADHDAARELVQIVRVHRLPQLEHHVVRHADHRLQPGPVQNL